MTAITAPLSQEKIKDIEQVQTQIRRWRLTDCSEETLIRMSQAIRADMDALAAEIIEGQARFQQFIDLGNPSGAMESQEEIENLSNEWKALKKHLRQVQNAHRELALRKRLSAFLGGDMQLYLFDALVLVLIIVVVGLTLVELLVHLSPETIHTIVVIDTVICFFLLGDVFLRFAMADHKGWFVKRYWIDFVSSLPINGILQFGRLARVARFARVVRLMRLSRALRVLLFAFRGLDKLHRTFELNLLKRSVITALALLVFGALSIMALEGPAEASIGSFNESLWWSFATVVTGGFADLYNPVTPTGRLITVGLILLGLTVTGIFTASLTSVLVEDESNRLEQQQHQLKRSLMAVDHKLDLLTGETKEALVLLEYLAQAIANQSSPEALAEMLAKQLAHNFNCLQASIHRFEPERSVLVRLQAAGLREITPPAEVQVGEGFLGALAGDLAGADLANTKLEPSQEVCAAVQGTAIACPLVAGHRFLGILHVVLPKNLSNDYLHTRLQMTIAHQAAVAFLALEEQR